MAKKKTEAPTEPSEEMGAPAATPATFPKISKADAVRAAVAEGIETPDEGVAFILKRYGLEVSKPQWSSYRSQEKARQAKKAGAGESAAVKLPPKASESARIPVPSGNGSNPAELARQVKQLVERFGANAVSDMVAVFSE